MSVTQDFWHRVDRSGGPEACWLWHGARDRCGRGWCRYAGRVKFAFSIMLDRLHPDLRWLAALMGDRAAPFIAAHEGQELTLTMKIPRRAEMIEEARAVDAYIQLRETNAEDREKVIERLAAQHACDEAQIARFATLGHELMNGTNKESADEKKRR